jgi:SAM-dependent methyltransferase
MKEKKLNVGCGKDYKNPREGWINLDFNRKVRADVYYDIDKFPWPFEGNSFSLVYCSHVLEHVNDLIKVMKEIRRISKDKAKVIIKVPLFPSIHSVNDPTHKRFFTYFTFEYFTNKNWYGLPEFEIISRKIKFSWHKGFGWLDMIINKFPVFYSRFFSSILPSNELNVELRVKKAK